MRSVPRVIRGAYRNAMRVALEEVARGLDERLETRMTQGWKLFLLLPGLLFWRRVRGGLVSMKDLELRFRSFQTDQWRVVEHKCQHNSQDPPEISKKPQVVRGIMVSDVSTGHCEDNRGTVCSGRRESNSTFPARVETRTGCECVSHVLQTLTDLDPTATILSGRPRLTQCHAEGFVDHGRWRRVLPFVRLFYGGASTFLWGDDLGGVHSVSKRSVNAHVVQSRATCSIDGSRRQVARGGKVARVLGRFVHRHQSRPDSGSTHILREELWRQNQCAPRENTHLEPWRDHARPVQHSRACCKSC